MSSVLDGKKIEGPRIAPPDVVKQFAERLKDCRTGPWIDIPTDRLDRTAEWAAEERAERKEAYTVTFLAAALTAGLTDLDRDATWLVAKCEGLAELVLSRRERKAGECRPEMSEACDSEGGVD